MSSTPASSGEPAPELPAPRPSSPAAEEPDTDAATPGGGPLLVPSQVPWQTRDADLWAAPWRRVAQAIPTTAGRILRVAWRVDRAATLGVIGCELVSAAAVSFGLVGTTGALAAVVDQGPTTQRLHAAIWPAVTVAAAAAARSLLAAGSQMFQSRLGPRIDSHTSEAVLAVITRSELAAYDDPEWCDAREAAEEGAERAQQVFASLTTAAGALLSLVAAGGVLAVLHPLLVVLLVAAVVPQAAASVRIARMRHRSQHATLTDRRWRTTLLSEMTYVGGAVEVRAHTMRGFLLHRYRQVCQRLHTEAAAVGRRAARTRLAGDAATGLGTTIVYVVLVFLTMRHTIPTAAAGTAALAVHTARAALAAVVEALNTATEHGLYLTDWDRFVRGDGVARHHLTRRGDQAAPTDWDAIRLSGVTYRYPNAEAPAVEDVSLTVPRGQVVALVGENGSGKTTLAKLLAGLYLPTGGTVTWGAVPVPDIASETLWEQTAMIPQDACDWPFTMRENITLGCPRPDGDAAVHRAAAASGADTVIEGLPHGLDTSLARSWWGGHDLSGGQWQRIAGARAVHREDASLLIADEPTSALDARAEAAFFDRVRALATPQRAVVLITHRLASVRMADRIYVLDHGCLVAEGTHEQLLAAGGLYADLYQLQASAYTTAA